MTDDGAESPRRTSSQTSDISNKSGITPKRRKQPRKTPSSASSIASPKLDSSLTSFPSLPPVPSPRSHGNSLSPPPAPMGRTVSQKVRDRKETLKGLTSASPPLTGINALFQDSPKHLREVPGALHLANDQHIERLIARSGAVKLLRQFAQDLAQRDAEISTLRVRTSDKERALKDMLLEADVPIEKIEQKLQSLDALELDFDLHDGDTGLQGWKGFGRSTSNIDTLIHEALSEGDGDLVTSPIKDEVVDLVATIRPIKSDKQIPGRSFTSESLQNGASTVKRQPEHGWGSSTSSRLASASSSIKAEERVGLDAATTVRPPNPPAGRRKGLDDVFQPPGPISSNSYFIGGTKARASHPASLPDDASVGSKRSAKSITSWTMRLFGGNSQATKDLVDPNSPRPSSPSFAHSEASTRKTSVTAAESAMAALAKDAQHGPPQTSKTSAAHQPTGADKFSNQTIRRAPTVGTMVSSSLEQVISSPRQENFGPVEMDAILPIESKPPTMTQVPNTFHAEGLLTDRFGFIYDQRQKRRRRDTLASVNRGNPPASLESLGNYRHDIDVEDDDDTWASSTHKVSGRASPTKRPMTPTSVDEQRESAGLARWQDYLKKSKYTRPAELLLHSPSAAPVVTVSTADATASPNLSGHRAMSISVSAEKVLPIASNPAKPNISLATASNTAMISAQPESTQSNRSMSPSSLSSPTREQEPVKLLLDRLTELHDSLQAEKETKWNEFLRKVRAERTSKVSDAPEADIVDGEVIGISSLGRPSKVNRGKYGQFKSLVLQGIPVSLRPKVWSECSGASARRSPGYYDDLILRFKEGRDLDSEIVSQIEADIGRTLTDNTFFRHGPGVARLKTILSTYSIHNPTVGYCQGMNLITASLLLIMPTSEDAFWILVAIIENILPSGYFDRGLLVSRADQIVLRNYVSEVLPKLGSHFGELGVELEACSFMWFLSLFTGCLSAEALYRVWDVLLCLNSSETIPGAPHSSSESESKNLPSTPSSSKSHPGSSSPFLFQLCLALLKLNESQLLALDSPAAVYSYVNHNMTNHAISIDGLISASEALRKVVKREDVLTRRAQAITFICG